MIGKVEVEINLKKHKIVLTGLAVADKGSLLVEPVTTFLKKTLKTSKFRIYSTSSTCKKSFICFSFGICLKTQ